MFFRWSFSLIRRRIHLPKRLSRQAKHRQVFGHLCRSTWEYGQYVVGNRSPNNHYPCMETDAICALPVKDIVAKDAVLFIWATNSHLEEAIKKVIPAWGFTYKANTVRPK